MFLIYSENEPIDEKYNCVQFLIKKIENPFKVPEVRIHTKCNIIVKDFPFDSQRCEINFYSWAHTAKQMTIKQVDNKRTTNTTYLRFISSLVLIHFLFKLF